MSINNLKPLGKPKIQYNKMENPPSVIQEQIFTGNPKNQSVYRGDQNLPTHIEVQRKRTLYQIQRLEQSFEELLRQQQKTKSRDR